MKRIAVVEDDVLMREKLSSILTKAGYQAEELQTFEDVPGQLSAIAPDLVLLDLNLPYTSLFQICREI